MRASISCARRAVSRLLRVLLVTAAAVSAVAAPGLAGEPWLFVNDLHYDPLSPDRVAHGYGDTSPPLLESAIAEMRRVAPDPPVIVMAGDFLPHVFRAPAAIPEMVWLAKRFNRAFPHAQFVIALGNEDSNCGDYSLPPNSAFARAVAAAWAPLVNRNGAAPGFARTFAHDGFYTAALPVAGLRAVVVDDAFWSIFHADGCGTSGDQTPGTFAELDAALAPGGSARRWLIMHIPPGIDARSTIGLTHRLAVVPFLRSQPQETALDLIADPARRVELVVTGHIHRFGFRIVERRGAAPVPILVSPALSPIYENAAAFLTADVSADGEIRALEEYGFVHRRWVAVGAFSTLGASEFSGPALANLQRRLAEEPKLRAVFGRLYVGGSRLHEITENNWRYYWCADTALRSSAFRACLNNRGFGLLTGRGLIVAGVLLVAVASGLGIAIVALIFIARHRRRRRAVR
jgi:hypothetical protein